jgi:ribosomal protein S18 acetylase RimI-like enzyme
MRVDVVTQVDDDLLAAFHRLVPQLSTSATLPGRAGLEAVIACPTNTVLVARDETGILGTLTLVVFPIPTGVRAWIEDVVVDEAARRKHAASALVDEALRIAGEKGARTVELTSRASREAAHRLYEGLGFQIRETNVYRHSGG